MKKIFKCIFITLISIPIILVLAYYFLIFIYIKWHDSKDDKILRMNKFDQVLWLDENRREDRSKPHHYSGCVRGEMYYDLIDNYLKVGMQKEEVFELLGKPAYGLKYPENKKRQYCLEYKLGGCSVSSGPGRILLVCIQNNKVKEIFHDSRNNNAETINIK